MSPEIKVAILIFLGAAEAGQVQLTDSKFHEQVNEPVDCGQCCMDKLVLRLFERTLKADSNHHGDLANTTLRKPGRLANLIKKMRAKHDPAQGEISGAVGQALSRVMDTQLPTAVTESVDHFIDNTYGSGMYQLRVLLLAGALYAFSFSMSQLCVFTKGKMINDPKLPQFTRESLNGCETLIFVGWALGTLVWGPAFDRWGRRSMTYSLALASGLAFICTGAATYLSRVSLYAYAVSNFIMGFGLPYMQGAYTIVIGIFPGNRRALATSLLNIGYSLALALMGLLCGTITRNLNWHLETLIWSGFFTLLVLIGFPLLHESLRFLVATGQVQKAAVVAEAVSRANGVGQLQLRPKIHPVRAPEQPVVKSNRLCERKLITRLCACAMNWITVSICYYGLTFAAGSISSNIYRYVMLIAMVDILGYFAPAPILSVLGRIRTMQVALIVAAIFLLLCGFLTPDSLILHLSVLLGRLSVDVAFSTTYLITLECFPTDCQATAFGISSSAGRFFTLLAPLLSDLPLKLLSMIFPSLCVLAAATTQLLPETQGKAIDTLTPRHLGKRPDKS